MKKFVCCLLAVLMLTALCACGGAKSPAATAAPQNTPAPSTEAPAPQDTTAPTAPPATPTPSSPDYPKLIPMGETAHVDLDGDGTDEAVCVSLLQQDDGFTFVTLHINGVDHTDNLYAEDAYFDCPDPDYWAITDV